MADSAVKIPFTEASAPSTPATGKVVIYAKTDGLLYSKDDAGTETLVSGGAGGGSVATDAIWDAAGDLAVGSGANTAAKLAIGTSGFVLTSNGTTAAWATPVAAGTIIGIDIETGGDQSIVSATLADLPTNIAVTFTVPASGKVIVRLAATAGATTAPTAGAYQSWGIRESTSIIAGGVGDSIAVRQPTAAAETMQSCVKEFYFTGLTPGASLTYKWAAANSVGTGSTFKASTNSPAIMTVIAAP
jgi:hypothetical protein